MNGERASVPTRMVVHALVREDGTVDGAELYEVAGLLGMTDQQVRLCVKRLVAEGRFTLEGRGRRAVLRLAAAVSAPAGAGAGDGLPGAGPAEGLPGLVPEVEFVRYAYRQDRGQEPWDGVWHAFAFAVPESARSARDALRDALTALGAAPVQGGLYVTPNAIGPAVGAANQPSSSARVVQRGCPAIRREAQQRDPQAPHRPNQDLPGTPRVADLVTPQRRQRLALSRRPEVEGVVVRDVHRVEARAAEGRGV